MTPLPAYVTPEYLEHLTLRSGVGTGRPGDDLARNLAIALAIAIAIARDLDLDLDLDGELSPVALIAELLDMTEAA